MPSDYDWPPTPNAIEALHDADLIFCHQGKPYRYDWYPRDKPTVGIYHSQPSHIRRRLEADGWPWAVIAQYQPRLYPGCHVVPNLIPLRHPYYQPGDKSTTYVRIAYSPSNRHLGQWDDKGYQDTLAILQRVAAHDGIGCEADIIMGVPLAESLERKARAHIVIDECVTGAYHRSSLEGLALGCVVLNACDWQSDHALKQVTGGAGNPFEVVDMDGLEDRLTKLIARGPERLIALGRQGRIWMERAWHPTDLIRRNFVPLIQAAMENATRRK